MATTADSCWEVIIWGMGAWGVAWDGSSRDDWCHRLCEYVFLCVFVLVHANIHIHQRAQRCTEPQPPADTRGNYPVVGGGEHLAGVCVKQCAIHGNRQSTAYHLANMQSCVPSILQTAVKTEPPA